MFLLSTSVICFTHHDNRCIGVGSEVTSLKNVTEVGRAGGEYEAMSGYVPPARGSEQNVSEGLRMQQGRNRAVEMSTVAVPLELVIF